MAADLIIGATLAAAALYGATMATLKTLKGLAKMYGNIPRNDWPSVSTRNRNPETLAAENRNRAAERRAANSPWPIDPNSAKAAEPKPEPSPAAAKAAAEFSEKESGRRVKITALIPETENRAEWQAAVDLLEFNLLMTFGGFTWQPFNGAWMDGQGEFIRDNGRAYLVSFEKAATDKGRADYARAIRLFQETGRAIGEEWLHIEVSSFTAEHTKTG